MKAPPKVPDGGLRLWLPVVGPIALWLAHLSVVGSLSRYSCNVHGDLVVQHLATAVAAIGVLVCMVLAVGLIWVGGDDESAGTAAGRTRFLGLFGLSIGVVNLALILGEGAYVVFIRSCT